MPQALAIGGFCPFSSLDYPGELSCVVFCQGCTWACSYCHNPHLRAHGAGSLSWTGLQAFLNERHGLLDAVVFSGGEPLLQASLANAMQTIRDQRFKVGLHTSGIAPQRLAEVLKYCDWVGLDMKTHKHKYATLTGDRRSAELAIASLDVLLSGRVPFEVRTTWHPNIMTEDELLDLVNSLARRGVQHFRLQLFRAGNCLDAEANAWPMSPISADLQNRIGQFFPDFQVR